MKLLLHSCCAPCTTYCLEKLREENCDILGYFHNPNIHPYTEFKRRLDTFREYCELVGHRAIIDETYGLREYMSAINGNVDERCQVCYRLRLEPAARTALESGCDAFSTTLLISPYQNHDLLRQVGEDVAREAGVAFAYFDFRPGYRRSVEMSKEMGLYRQPYCGCVFSEEERYNPALRRKNKH